VVKPPFRIRMQMGGADDLDGGFRDIGGTRRRILLSE
jgi:hypothetical protein